MSMSIGGASIVVVEHKHGAMHCDAFKGKLEAVLQMIDRGDLGGANGYGCDEHKAALDRVARQLAETRRCIAEQEANEAKCSKCCATGELDPDGVQRCGECHHDSGHYEGCTQHFVPSAPHASGVKDEPR